MDTLTTMGSTVGALLKERGETIAIAESSAGGLVSSALMSVPGASNYFVAGGVVYTRDARRGLLDVPEEVVTMRASTEEYALIMARIVRERFDTTWGLAESGATGPTGNRYGDDAGHGCFAIAGPVERATTLETGSPDREANMWQFARGALALMEAVLKDQ